MTLKPNFKKSLTGIVKVGLLDKIIEIQTNVIFNSDCSEEEFQEIKVNGMLYFVISQMLLKKRDEIFKEGNELRLKKNIEKTFLKFLNTNFEMIKNDLKESLKR